MKIWSVQMQAMSQAELELAPGGNIAMHSIDRDTGLLGGEGCENNVELPFILDSQPAQQADCVEQSGGGWLQNLFGL